MRTIELVARVTPDSAQALWYELESRFDTAGSKPAITVDASAVRHLSAAAVQVLLVAQRRAQRDGGALVLASPSPDCVDCLRVMGATALIGEGVA
ncbi:STAS domain-containing protein [Pseudotabrizicola algicola]|uniref:STAS domain-containing protein n=1 Tax=Pseudotabrizicola algicola TaxID=2709381 RepID=A0A6B3RJZ6_9RHOB|nr:STAS domain-containing protein [Pseudotabrizicola algicola]NEX45731.1 STAS domain-containing protein [Pseudotabrizicola algicola]